MQSTTTPKETKMVKTHLARLIVLAITAAMVIAAFAPMAMAGGHVHP